VGNAVNSEYAVLVIRLLCCEVHYVCVNSPLQQRSGNLAQCNVSAAPQYYVTEANGSCFVPGRVAGLGIQAGIAAQKDTVCNCIIG